MPRGKKTATTKRKATTRKRAAKAKAEKVEAAKRTLPVCAVVGCEAPSLAVHDGPHGKVHLCGHHDLIAKQNLADEAAKQDILDAMATPFEKSMQRQAVRRREAVARAGV